MTQIEKEKHKAAFDVIFNDLKSKGKLVKPRGLLVREIENYSYTLPPYVRFPNYDCRKLNIPYVKREFAWYLKGDRFDKSICDHAKTWRDIVNADGSINSNYGQYLFNFDSKKNTSQFWNVIEALRSDKDTRRASMTILNPSHLLSDTKDVPCTYALNFRIRDNVLNMTVHMRSQDAIYGMGNDAPAFSFIHEMVHSCLGSTYVNLGLGNYCHFADSFHVYERHFQMLDTIVAGDNYELIDCPRMSGVEEVTELLTLNASMMPPRHDFSRWLYDV